MRRNPWAAVGMALACWGSPAIAAVRVVDSGGRPLPGAEVTCLDPPGGAVSTDRDGVASLVGHCARARCAHDRFVATEIDSGRADALCTLLPGAVVSISVQGDLCPEGCRARLVAARGAGAAVADVPLPVPAQQEQGATPEVRFPAVLPRTYHLEVARADGSWSCSGSLGPLSAGVHDRSVEWREPLALAGRVTDPDGKSVVGMPVRTWSDRHTWECGGSQTGPAPTDGEGRFRVPVDRARPMMVAAGSWTDPRGLAVIELAQPGSRPVVLHPVLPVRVQGHVVRGEDQPAACKTHLLFDTAQPLHLAERLTGSAQDASCDAAGEFKLGPFLPTEFRVQLFPEGGLPMRLTRPSPAPGSTVDVGTLHIEAGAAVRAIVVDQDEFPVQEAKVRATGRETLILSAEGTTDDTGAVNLDGLPPDGRVDLEVEATGFVPYRQRDLDLEGSPFHVKLTPGGGITGTLRDRSNEPISGGTVTAGTAERPELASMISGEDGALHFEGLPAGEVTLEAHASGYKPGRTEHVRVRRGEVQEGVEIVLDPAHGLAGRVVDPDGRAVPGTRIVLFDPRAGLGTSLAETLSDSDGSFEVVHEPEASQHLAALKVGYGPALERAPLGKVGQPLELTLSVPARLLVRLPRGMPGASISVTDGYGLGRTLASAGAEVLVEDLAPGQGIARLLGGPSHEVDLAAGQTAEVTLDVGATIEGRVTLDGLPVPRAVVSATGVTESDLSTTGPTEFTDETGFYRIQGAEARRTLIVARAHEGRAERWVEIPTEGTLTVDLAITAVVLAVEVLDAKSHGPISGAGVQVTSVNPNPHTTAMGSTSTAPAREPGYELQISNCGWSGGQTGPGGNVRLTVPETGAHDLVVHAQGYDLWHEALDLAAGEASRTVELQPKPTAHLFIDVVTDPPGLHGSLYCASGHSSSSNQDQARLHMECGGTGPGLVAVAFRIEHYGTAYREVDVPQEGEVTIALEVRRGGTLVVPYPQDVAGGVSVTDEPGVDWTRIMKGMNGRVEEVKGVGRAVLFEALPAGAYLVSVGGTARAPIVVRPGETTVAW